MRSTDKIIKFILVFSIVMVIRYIGIENIPYCVILFIILSGILYFVWSIFRIRKSKNKDKYYIIFALNLIAFSISIFFLEIMPVKYKFLTNYLLIPTSVIFLIIMLISVIAWSIASNKK